MGRRLIVGGLAVAIIASVAGFPFEILDAHAWSGLSFVVWSLGLFTAAGLLTVTAIRVQDDVGAVGFSAVALYRDRRRGRPRRGGDRGALRR